MFFYFFIKRSGFLLSPLGKLQWTVERIDDQKTLRLGKERKVTPLPYACAPSWGGDRKR
jgi:hypothetical protein